MDNLKSEGRRAKAPLRAEAKRAGSGLRYPASRSGTIAIYRRLTAEFCRYTLDVPENSFPTFLESLHFEHQTEK